MKAVIQRVNDAALTVDGKVVSKIGKGLVVYLGVAKGDGLPEADYMVRKISSLRIFEDENGKTNKSLKDVDGEILFVSQFTLLANTAHGNRPDFLDAEGPEIAEKLYNYAAEKLKEHFPVKLGVFGADMKINQTNDGPFTIIMEKTIEK